MIFGDKIISKSKSIISEFNDNFEILSYNFEFNKQIDMTETSNYFLSFVTIYYPFNFLIF
jgi:hypothetical protein